MNIIKDKICVCVCTYKRPLLLMQLLKSLLNQQTDNQFLYSIVIVDNDVNKSAESVVSNIKSEHKIEIDYHIEPDQNIALARNKAIENAKGSYVAFIDDDEIPPENWLTVLFQAIKKYPVDGVLGPVKPYFRKKAPNWVYKGRFFERPSHKTGHILDWTETRTGNVLIKKSVFDNQNNIFHSKFGRGGEDRDFFKRLIESNHIFVWCEEASVYEEIPSQRISKSFMIRRALVRGQNPGFNATDYIKSIIIIPLYICLIPFSFLLGYHNYVRLLVKTFDHIGRLLSLIGIDIVKDRYVVN